MKYLLKLWNSPTFTSWANLLVQTVNILFIIPLIWKQWGSLELGVYFVITAINRFSYLFADRLAITFSMLVTFVDAGSTDLQPRESLQAGDPASNVAPDPNAPHPSRDEQLFGRLFGTIGTMLLLISLVVGVISGAMGAASIQQLGREFGELPAECVTAFWIGMAAVVFRLNFFRYEIVLQGLNRVAVLARWNAIFNTFSSIACVIVVFSGYSILVWSLVFNGMIIASCVRNFLLANAVTEGQLRRLPLFAFDRQVLNASWGPTWRGLIGHVSFVGAEQVAVIVAPYFMTGVEALSFSIYARLLSMLGPIAQVPFTSQIPRMARMIARNELSSLQTLSTKRIAISCLLVIFGGWGVGVLFPWLPWLLKKDFIAISPFLWGLFVFLIFHDRFSILCTATMEAGNKVVMYWQRLFCVVCTVILFPGLSWKLGATGAILALYGPRAVVMAVTPVILAADYLKVSPGWIWKRAWFPPAGVHLVLWIGLGTVLTLFAPPAESRGDRASTPLPSVPFETTVSDKTPLKNPTPVPPL